MEIYCSQDITELAKAMLGVLLDAEISEIEEGIKTAYQFSGIKGWINTDGHRFRVTNSSRKILDKEGLQHELKDILNGYGAKDIDIQELFSRHEKTGAVSFRLTINNI